MRLAMNQTASNMLSSETASRHITRLPKPFGRSRQLRVVGAVKKGSDKYVVCSKTLIVKKEASSQVFQLCQDVTKVFQSKLGNRQSGIQAFECVQDRWDENVFHFYERYDTAAAFGRHVSDNDFKGFMERVSPFLEKPIGMSLYEYENGQLGATALNMGPKGEGGLDDATGASGAASASSMKQTSATIDLTQVSADDDEEDDFRKDLSQVTKGLQNMLQNVFAGLGGKK